MPEKPYPNRISKPSPVNFAKTVLMPGDPLRSELNNKAMKAGYSI